MPWTQPDDSQERGISESIAALVAESGSPVNTVLKAAFAPADRSRLAPGRRWCFLGDSITNGSTAGNFTYSFSHIAVQGCGTLNAREDYIEAGTSGYTSGQALSFFPTVLAGGYGIEGLVVLLGTNDSSGSVPLSTYAANMAQIVSLAKAQGMPVVLCTVPPKGGANATTAAVTSLHQYNHWIRLWGPTHGCEVAEVYGALVDPTSGNLSGTYDSSDGTHPNPLGHAVMGDLVGKAMLRAMGNRTTGMTYAKSIFSLIPNPLMTGGSSSTKPGTWFEQPGGTGTAPTYSTFADTTGLLSAGVWAQMDFDATAAGGTRQMAISPTFTGVNPGDTVALSGMILVEDITGTWQADVVAGNAGASAQLNTSSSALIDKFMDRFPGRNIGNAFGTGNTVWQIGPLLSPTVIPAGTTGLLFYLPVWLPTGKHVKVRFGAIDLIDLTAIGTASLVGAPYTSIVHLDGP